MNRKELEKILHQQIPLSEKMGIKVKTCGVKGGVQFSLPLVPNRNHKNTAFGGTLVAAQALACWSLIMVYLRDHKINAEVVLQRQNAEFLRPVPGDFLVRTQKMSVSQIKFFAATLNRHAKARLTVEAQVMIGRKVAAVFRGDYVALKHKAVNKK